VRLLLLNLRTDVDDTALGFTTAWINAIAPKWERIDVLTLHAGRLAIADNVVVRSMGRERGFGRLRMLVRFYRLAIGITVRSRPDVCFAHMTPRLASLLWPIRKLSGMPLLLWYAHGSVTRELKIAERLADRCATSTSGGFRLPSTKLAILGQGVDVARFRPAREIPEGYEQTVLVLGRITPSKRVDEAIRAFALAHQERTDLRLRVVGGPVTRADDDYMRAVGALVSQLGLDDAVQIVGAVPYARIADQYTSGGLFLNLGTTGSLDKAILEAMACGCIPISRNDAFTQLAASHGLHDLIAGAEIADVAAALVRLAGLAAPQRARLRAELRSIVAREHSLERLAGEIQRELEALVESGGRTR
jgi:glycosyltransferase involved in cell wall biosynthesis